jgi:hypothetical protein
MPALIIKGGMGAGVELCGDGCVASPDFQSDMRAVRDAVLAQPLPQVLPMCPHVLLAPCQILVESKLSMHTRVHT